MKWFLLFTGVVAGLLLVALVGGLFVPRRHEASVRRIVPGTPEEVWAAITTPSEFPEWRPGVDRVEVQDRGGEGVERWVEHGPTGAMGMEVEERDPPRRLVVRIVGDELPFGGSWTWELEPEGSGTAVTLTEDGRIDNPLFRFMARFVLGYEATMRDYLEGLEDRMESAAGG